jgi:hypothetical protein
LVTPRDGIHAFERQEGVPLGVAATSFDPRLPPKALPGRLPRKDPPPPTSSRSDRSVHGDAPGVARAGVSSH